MNWFAQIWNRLTQAWLPRYRTTGGGMSGGMLVDVNTSMQSAAVSTCVRVIAETIATLGWNTYTTRADGTSEKLGGGAVDWVLNFQANPEMTAFSWRELALAQVLLIGNHYSEIERDRMGRPLWLWPIPPEYVQPMRDETGALVYRVTNMQGGQSLIDAANMLHIHGLGWDGIVGYSVLANARRTIGTALAMDEYGANFYANGVQPGPIITHPKALSEGARENLKKSLDERRGPGRSFKAMLLEEGMTVAPPAMTMVDAQFLESRKMQVAEICRWFRVPPHKAQDLERSTNNNIEHQSIEFVQDTILPWCRRLEQEVDVKLFGRQSRNVLHTRLNIDTLLRGDIISRFTAYEKGRNGGWLNADEIRALEKLNPIPGGVGKIYLQPMNFVPLGTEPKPVPAPAAADPAAPAADPDAASEPKALMLAKVLQMSDYGAALLEKQRTSNA